MRGAPAARVAAESFWPSACAAETSGKGNEFVISRTPFFSMPTKLPVAREGKDLPLAVAILIATYILQSVQNFPSVPSSGRAKTQWRGSRWGKSAKFARTRASTWTVLNGTSFEASAMVSSVPSSMSEGGRRVEVGR